MSHSSQKNGGNNNNSNVPPRQIRFVSTDGQPQTKRRRVNAACRTCRRRKIRCSGEQPVCKTCSDFNHTCLGYSDPPSHTRSQSDTASQRPTITAPSEVERSRATRAVESHSPDPPPRTTRPSISHDDKLPEIPKFTDLEDTYTSKDASSRVAGDSERQVAGSPDSSRSSSSASNRTHVPYFRYFGPTAIVPGFKQMVVEVRGSRKSNPSWSSDSPSSPRSPKVADLGLNSLNALADTNRDANTIPFYDGNDTLPVSNLVTHLCELFFEHLGCNFPFLQRDRFLRDLKDKKVNTMLVNAVCALSARFSPHPLLCPPQAPAINGVESPQDVRMSDRGQPFARRAMSALVGSLSCPTLSVAQACLLLAYEEFGSNRDSGLWMYLGISIRMAQDLGMQKRRGPKYNHGPGGPASHAIMTGKPDDDHYEDPELSHSMAESNTQDIEDYRARKREREDTFWCIFFLDRVISSGTGRPVTLRDEEIELGFPTHSESVASNGWPAPFPPLIRIIHLYGRVTDIINGIQDVNGVTEDTVKRLAGLESDLTGIYSALSSKLYFDATNLQEYVMAKEGTSFILLHLWFHALIVLLHQPTLLHSFGGTIQQLYPNSRTLAMSSAKTIADIYSFSELLDNKSFTGNPFTSQPMYIAACAFLMESAYYSSPASKSGVSPQPLLANQSSGFVMPDVGLANGSEHKSIGSTQHSLLAHVAKENYQRCYKALKALDVYWDGTKYILTVLDQKAKGIVDPLLYTAEDVGDAAKVPPAVQSLGPASWQRAKSPSRAAFEPGPSATTDALPKLDPSQAIGWALTNAANSHNPNLSVLYQNPSAQANAVPNKPTYSSQYSHSYPSLPAQSSTRPSSNSYSQSIEPPRHAGAIQSPSIPTESEKYRSLAPAGGMTTPDTNLLLGLNAPYSNAVPRTSSNHPSSSYTQNLSTSGVGTEPPAFHYHMPSDNQQAGNSHVASRTTEYHPSIGSNASDVLIESQNIDMNMLHHSDQFPFGFNGDAFPWLEYLPPDVTSFLGEHQHYSSS